MDTVADISAERHKLLVADDEAIIRTRLKELGENLGFSVVTAADGVEAWQAFLTEQPDLVILDIYMPRMNGLVVLSKIKGAVPECPVILITGFLNYEQLVNVSSVKPDGCIIKPLNSMKTGALMLKLVQREAEAVAMA